jgi:thiamine phosphate synthase YjbQ (UPF0047 family)
MKIITYQLNLNTKGNLIDITDEIQRYLAEFDIRSRQRRIILQFIGE